MATPWEAKNAEARARKAPVVPGPLIRMDLHVGHPGVVVHRGVDEIVAMAPDRSGLGTSAVDPPAAPVGDPSELLDLDVNELSRALPLVASDDPARGAVHPVQPVQTVAAQDTIDRGSGMTERPPQAVGSVLGLASSGQDPGDLGAGRACGHRNGLESHVSTS